MAIVRQEVPGITSRIVPFRSFILASGLPNATLAWNSTNINAKYTRHGATPTVITLATCTQGTYTSGGLIAVNAAAASYELHVPNAAYAPGADSVTIDIWDSTATPVFYCESIVVDLRLSTGVLHQGLAQAGAAGTITLAATAVATDSYYSGGLAVIVAGTGVGQARYVASYVGATKVATITPNWVTTPDTTSVVQVFGGSSAGADIATINGQTASASGTVTFPAATLASTTNITAGTVTTATNVTTVNGLAANVITAASINAAAITAAKFATDALDANALAATAVAEMQTGLATTAALGTAQTAITAIKTTTDKLTFTVANQVDANMLSVKNVALIGDGAATKFHV